jgi:DNA-binding GntR family transcriptional regulator
MDETVPRTLNVIERDDPLVERVTQEITDAIVKGVLSPGDKLVEAWLGEQLGVSRAPIREALRRLEQMGLVVKVPYKGAFVATLTDHDIAELNSLRAPLEGLAARLIAEKRDPHSLERLAGILNEMRQAARTGNASQMIRLDIEFHDALIELSGHKLLGEVWMVVRFRLRRFLLLKRKRLYNKLDDAMALHVPIYEALVAGDPGKAERLAQEHIAEAWRLFHSESASAAQDGKADEITESPVELRPDTPTRRG